MAELLLDLQHRRAELLEQISRLANFRAGCVTALVRRCGKSGCRCAKPGDPGHGPNIRLTFKVDGRTYSESLADPVVLRKVQMEIAEFRKFQELIREFVDVNTRICRLPSVNVKTQSRTDRRA
jgi:hypothetical protein